MAGAIPLRADDGYHPLSSRGEAWVHETAVVSPGAVLEDGVRIGPYAIIGENVVLGRGTTIGPHSIIDGWTRIGRNCRVFSAAVLGSEPQDLKFSGGETHLEIGDDNIIREFVTVNRATGPEGLTSIGNNNLLMAYVHIAHDCRIGNQTILANAVNLAGHVVVEDYAIIGGLTPVHQFVRIGRHSFVGGGSRVPKDVPPYVRAAGNPIRVVGLNSVGLTRRGFSEEVQQDIKRAYRVLYRSGLNVSQAVAEIRRRLPVGEETRHFLEFVERSERGITG